MRGEGVVVGGIVGLVGEPRLGPGGAEEVGDPSPVGAPAAEARERAAAGTDAAGEHRGLALARRPRIGAPDGDLEPAGDERDAHHREMDEDAVAEHLGDEMEDALAAEERGLDHRAIDEPGAMRGEAVVDRF